MGDRGHDVVAVRLPQTQARYERNPRTYWHFSDSPPPRAATSASSASPRRTRSYRSPLSDELTRLGRIPLVMAKADSRVADKQGCEWVDSVRDESLYAVTRRG